VALDHFTTLRDAVAGRGSSPALAHGLAGRSMVLALVGRFAEAADDGRRALAVAPQLGYMAGEALALGFLSQAAYYAGDFTGVVQLARQAGQIPADSIPGWIARASLGMLTSGLIETGDLAGGPVPLHHAGGDAPAGADRDALVFRPGPDVAAVLAAGCGRARPAPRCWSRLAGVLDKGRKLLAERPGVLRAQVDLVRRAAEPELHGLVAQASVQIVYEPDGYLCCHPSS
jgi:hypothetical protein